MKSSSKIILEIFLIVMLSSCSGGGGGGGGGGIIINPTPNPSVKPTVTPAPPKASGNVLISQSAIMPVVASGSGQNFQLLIYNNSNEAVKLISATAVANTYAQGSTISGITTSLYDMSACSSILAQQSTCIIKIKPQGSDGRFALNANFQGQSSNSIYTAAQLIQYGAVAANNGFSSGAATLTAVAATNQIYYISLPFVLDNTYSGLNVTSNVNPVSAAIVSCMGNAYTAGNSCTAHLAFHGGSYLNTITISGIASVAQALTQSKLGLNASTIESNTTSFQLQASSLNMGNLINDGLNAVIRVAQGVTPISIMNNGLASANITGIIGANGMVISESNNTCLSTLAPNQFCTFYVSSTAQQNVPGSIVIQSNLGPTTFNTQQVESGNAPGLSVVANGEFLNSIVNSANQVKVLITNSSTTPTTLNSLNFAPLPASFSFAANSDINACATGSESTTLTQNESCSVVINYTPSALTPASNLNLSVTATYESADTSIATIYSNIAIAYSAVNQSAILTFSPTTLNLTAISTNNQQTSESTITLTNNGATSASGISFNTATLAANNITLLNNQCTATLGPLDNCTITVRFGPVATSVESSVSLIASYTPSAGSGPTTSYLPINIATLQYALITVSGPLSIGSDTIGLTSSGSIFNFYPTPGQYLHLRYVYTNIGGVAANSFNLNLNTLPFGAQLDESSSTCPTDTTISTLNVGDSCNLDIAFLNDAVINNFSPSQTYLLYTPGYSYNDIYNGVVRVEQPNPNPETVNSLDWTTGTVIPSYISFKGRNAIELQFTQNTLATDAAIVSGAINYSVTNLDELKGFDVYNSDGSSGTGSCTMVPSVKNCNMILQAESGMPVGNYVLDVQISALSGVAQNRPIRGSVTVSVTP